MNNLIQKAVEMTINDNNSAKNVQKTEKMEEKIMEKSLLEQKEELKKSKPELFEKLREVAKEEKPVKKSNPKPKSTKREVTTMSDREKAEKILTNVCKELKLSAPHRLATRADSKTGLGGLMANGACGSQKVTVKSDHVLVIMPQKELGCGKQAHGRYVHMTVFRLDDPNLEKAFRKALKDKKSKDAWAKEMGYVPRQQGAPKVVTLADLKRQEEAVKAKLDAIKQARAMLSKAAKPKSKTKKSNKPVVAPVANPEPTVA